MSSTCCHLPHPPSTLWQIQSSGTQYLVIPSITFYLASVSHLLPLASLAWYLVAVAQYLVAAARHVRSLTEQTSKQRQLATGGLAMDPIRADTHGSTMAEQGSIQLLFRFHLSSEASMRHANIEVSGLGLAKCKNREGLRIDTNSKNIDLWSSEQETIC